MSAEKLFGFVTPSRRTRRVDWGFVALPQRVSRRSPREASSLFCAKKGGDQLLKVKQKYAEKIKIF